MDAHCGAGGPSDKAAFALDDFDRFVRADAELRDGPVDASDPRASVGRHGVGDEGTNVIGRPSKSMQFKAHRRSTGRHSLQIWLRASAEAVLHEAIS